MIKNKNGKIFILFKDILDNLSILKTQIIKPSVVAIKNPIRRRIMKDPITISVPASNRIKELLSSNPSAIAIRLGVKKRGCNGLSFTMNYITDSPEDIAKIKFDDIVKCYPSDDINGNVGMSVTSSSSSSYSLSENPNKEFINVHIDPNAIINIVGTNMDFVEDEVGSEFTFNNPNAKGGCGCGESFNV